MHEVKAANAPLAMIYSVNMVNFTLQRRRVLESFGARHDEEICNPKRTRKLFTGLNETVGTMTILSVG